MIPIPDIRERNDRPKDKQSKHQATSTVQRQMVQKFVKELNDSTKQPDRSGSAESTATEQVETTTREIVHEAVQLPHRVFGCTAPADTSDYVQSEKPMQSSHVPDAPHQRADTPRARSEPAQPQGEPAPTPQEQSRRACIQQTAKASIAAKAPERSTIPNATPIEKRPRQRMEDIRTRPEAKQAQGVPTSAPQGQGRRAYVQRAKKSRADDFYGRDFFASWR